MNTAAKHATKDGWTFFYQPADKAAYSKGAVENGADIEFAGPTEEGWHWYNEETGECGCRVDLDAAAAAPKLLAACEAAERFMVENRSFQGCTLHLELIAAINLAKSQ